MSFECRFRGPAASLGARRTLREERGKTRSQRPSTCELPRWWGKGAYPWFRHCCSVALFGRDAPIYSGWGGDDCEPRSSDYPARQTKAGDRFSDGVVLEGPASEDILKSYILRELRISSTFAAAARHVTASPGRRGASFEIPTPRLRSAIFTSIRQSSPFTRSCKHEAASTLAHQEARTRASATERASLQVRRPLRVAGILDLHAASRQRIQARPPAGRIQRPQGLSHHSEEAHQRRKETRTRLNIWHPIHSQTSPTETAPSPLRRGSSNARRIAPSHHIPRAFMSQEAGRCKV
ncbi:hypothetical protein L1887_56624 [Cichorium endivia]|nr:hypothetical protein L1887_56624 [Cichorium endivia]